VACDVISERFITDVCYASVAMDSPLASPAKAAGASSADESSGPCPRFVTNEELHILQTCLTRWRTEVEHDIKGNSLVIYFVINSPVKVTCYSAAYMSQSRDQKRSFTVSIVAADWH